MAPARLALIRSAVDAQLLEPAWSRERLAREFALDPRCQLVGCVAQLIPRKGHELLIEAWRDVAAACPDARLLLFGQGPLEARLRRSIRAAGLEGSVILAGFRTDLPAFLGRLDLLVHPGAGGGARARGAGGAGRRRCRWWRSAPGGVPEIVADGRTGYLVRAGDAPAMAIALTELLQNEARRRAFGEAAWAWVAQEFRVADMVGAHLTLYRELIETRARMNDFDRQAADLVRRIAAALSAKSARVAVAESCTGGWIAKCLTDLPGSSGWFGYGFVTYSDTAKQELLGVSAETLAEQGAVCQDVAEQMATGARLASAAEIAVAVTGIAGPDGGSRGQARRHRLLRLGRARRAAHQPYPPLHRRPRLDPPPGRDRSPRRASSSS